MEVYSNVLTCVDVYNALAFAQNHGQDIYSDLIRVHLSRKAAVGITVHCESLHGKRNRNGRPGKAATWDAWGYMMVYLYNRDPNALIGTYKSLQDFKVRCESNARWHRFDGSYTGNFLECLTV